MKNAIRLILTVFVIVLIVAVLAAAVLGVTAFRRPYPETDGWIEVAGLQAEVEVYRDAYGVPNIYAENEHDLFFAQGYVHAQDRFWQMEFWRHIGQGRLAEIIGEDGVEIDKFIRTMGWPRLAAEALAAYEEDAPEWMRMLDAYSEGVNAYLEEHSEELSVNATVLGLVRGKWEIEPWTPLNTIAWGVVMADDLSGNWDDELDRAKLIREVGEARVANLIPEYDYRTRPVIAPTKDQVNELPESAVRPATVADADWAQLSASLVGTPPPAAFTLGDGPFLGSNNWVISGKHTASGLPLLANDPHLGIQMPSIWYEVGLHAPGWDVSGFSFAGVPAVVIGHNDRIAWGVTNVGPDVQDLYLEKINPSNPDQYEYEGRWHDMEIIDEVIKVNGGEDVALQVRQTRHGPIINELVEGSDEALAFRWTVQDQNRIFQAVVLLNQARDFDDFQEALAFWDVPSQNFVYADIDGNIGYQMPGLVPVRANGDGRVPVPGWTGEYEWDGWIPYEELPALYNPDRGYIVTANNAVVDTSYPHFIASQWDFGDRAQRISELIEASIKAGKVTADNMATIQFDDKSLFAEQYLPLLNGLSSGDTQVQAALERLRGWDMHEHVDSVPATLFEIFFMKLAYAALADDVGEENVERVINGTFMHQLADQPDAEWWDDASTTELETRDDIILRALGDAVAWLEERLGSDMNDWQWGSLHTATFVSDPLGRSGIGVIESLVNRGPYPSSGGRTLVNNTAWQWENPAAITSHPSMRMIVDLSDFDAGRAVMPTGQSGHPGHRHYDDMIDLWLGGEYHAWPYSREAVEAAAADLLVLAPAQE